MRATVVGNAADMPILIRSIDREHHELEAVASGPINYEQIEKHLIEERNIQGLAYKEFVDARDADLVFALSPMEIRQIVALIRNLCQQCQFGPTAVLVATDFAFGIMRAMEMLLDDVAEIRPFREERLARSWWPADRSSMLHTGKPGCGKILAAQRPCLT